MIVRPDGDGVNGRDTYQVLNASLVGQRWAHNIGPVATLRYLAANVPFDCRVDVKGDVHAVWVLRAVKRSDGSRESGCRVSWSRTTTGIKVTAIDVSDSDEEYDIELGIVAAP